MDLPPLRWPGGSDVSHAERIASLNEAQRRGWTRLVGVGSHNVTRMADAIRQSPAPITTNQAEYHPWLDPSKLPAAARAAGLSVTAHYTMADGKSARDPALVEIGRAQGKSAAQVALRWLVQQLDVAALSKTAKVSRLGENLAVFDFDLSGEGMAHVFAWPRQMAASSAPRIWRRPGIDVVGWVIHPPYRASPFGIRKCPVAWAKRRARLSCHASTWTEA